MLVPKFLAGATSSHRPKINSDMDAFLPIVNYTINNNTTEVIQKFYSGPQTVSFSGSEITSGTKRTYNYPNITKADLTLKKTTKTVVVGNGSGAFSTDDKDRWYCAYTKANEIYRMWYTITSSQLTIWFDCNWCGEQVSHSASVSWGVVIHFNNT